MTSSSTAAPMPYRKPLPAIADDNKPFLDGLRRHRFLVPKCGACGDYSWIPHPACRSCLSEDLTWTPVSGDATVYSFTIAHRGPGAFALDVPYAIVLGELVEQPRPCLVVGNLVGALPGVLEIGMPIRIGYHDVPEHDATLWHWTTRA